jgi:Tfp pilus assembly PilM family ATPase
MPAPRESSEGFDPYRAWLNVRHPERPLNAYHMLGLPLLEASPEAIRAAARVRRKALLGVRAEAVPETWEKIYAELEEVVAVLSDPQRKAAYDARLQSPEATDAPPRRGPAAPGKTSLTVLRCPQCRTQNPATRSFCVNCGSNLWEACFCCGTVDTADEKYCGACGADLVSGVQEQLRHCDEQLQRAAQLHADCRFDDAIAALKPVSRIEHSLLAAHAGRAAGLMTQYAARRDQLRAETEAAYAEAQQLAAAGDCRRALERLDAIAAELRDEKIAQLRDEVQARVAEIETLQAEIRAAEKSPSLGLLAKVSRLLELQPDSDEALQLGRRLASAVAKAAGKRLAGHKYDEALALLAQVPESLESAEIKALRGPIEERAWLACNLRSAPLVDKPLVSLAERLVQLEPADSRARKLLGELRRRAAAAGKNGQAAVVPWAAAPKQLGLGPRVDWLTGFQRIAAAEDFDTAPLAEHPGRFFVACGLALQALGHAAFDANLLPEGGGMLSRVARRVSKRAVHAAWGLDVGPSGLKALKLVVDPKDQAVRIAACALIEHPKPLSQAVNDKEERLLTDETLRAFVSQHDVKGSRLALGLPPGMLLTKQVKMPRSDAEKLARALSFEARILFPLPLDQLEWAHASLDDRPEDDVYAAPERDVLVMAAKRVQLKDRIARAEALGLPLDIVQSDCLALANFLAYEYFDKADEGANGAKQSAPQTTAPVALLDVGSTTTHLVVASPGLTWIRSTGLGSEHFNKALVRQFHITLSQAEALKRDPAAAPDIVPFYDAIDSVCASFFEELAGWLAELATTHRQLRLGRILGVGGGFLMHGLLRHLRQGK